jgi:hypothetical protein
MGKLRLIRGAEAPLVEWTEKDASSHAAFNRSLIHHSTVEPPTFLSGRFIAIRELTLDESLKASVK